MWLVKFDPSKSESLIVSRKLKKPYHPPIYMGNTRIAEVNTHKHLGIILSHDCSWHAHIEHKKEKTWQRINIMRRLKFILDRKSSEITHVSVFGIWKHNIGKLYINMKRKSWIKFKIRQHV